MVRRAREVGIKKTAREYNTSPHVVRKWKRRYEEEGKNGLEDRSRRPKRMPRAIGEEEKEKIVKLRKKYKRLGARQVKRIEGLDISEKTIRKIWREAGVSRRRRRKKSEVKKNLREKKREYKLYERASEDTKELGDIPEYYVNMKRKKLPRIQYTHREVSTGIMFMGFGDERSLQHSTIFAIYINRHLEAYGLLPEESIRQTDNGSEYIGSWNAKKESSYTKEINRIKGQRHVTIFPGAKTCQSDVETVHNIVEMEFYEIEGEGFKDREDFMEKAYSYQLFFNFERPNTYKEDKTPWELAKEKKTDICKEALMLPPIDLDAVIREYRFDSEGGNDLFSDPITFLLLPYGLISFSDIIYMLPAKYYLSLKNFYQYLPFPHFVITHQYKKDSNFSTQRHLHTQTSLHS